ncbi:MAG TPA: hypothetical protein VLY46_02180 [Usitatibacter sp.]|nr:hypothetical protein [Usitatibacter sp.]
MLEALGIVFIVYLFALASGLFLVALERTFPRPAGKRRGSPAELPDVELAGCEAFRRFSPPGIAVRALFRGLRHRPNPRQR